MLDLVRQPHASYPESYPVEFLDDVPSSPRLRLSAQRAVLVDAKHLLRELLKSSFSVEELLFQTDTHPHR